MQTISISFEFSLFSLQNTQNIRKTKTEKANIWLCVLIHNILVKEINKVIVQCTFCENKIYVVLVHYFHLTSGPMILYKRKNNPWNILQLNCTHNIFIHKDFTSNRLTQKCQIEWKFVLSFTKEKYSFVLTAQYSMNAIILSSVFIPTMIRS